MMNFVQPPRTSRWKTWIIIMLTTAGEISSYGFSRCISQVVSAVYSQNLYSRIYNDVITLRRGSGFMWEPRATSCFWSWCLILHRTKLSLSHALAQSVKISLVSDQISYYFWNWCFTEHSQFEELISSTIEDTKDIPEVISETGKVGMPHKG